MAKIINKYSLPIYICTLILCFIIGIVMTEHRFTDVQNIGVPIVNRMYKLPILSFIKENINPLFHILIGLVYLIAFSLTYVVVALIIITLFVTGNTKIHIITLSVFVFIALLNSLDPFRPSGQGNMYWTIRSYILDGRRNSMNFVIIALALDLFHKHIQPKLK